MVCVRLGVGGEGEESVMERRNERRGETEAARSTGRESILSAVAETSSHWLDLYVDPVIGVALFTRF